MNQLMAISKINWDDIVKDKDDNKRIIGYSKYNDIFLMTRNLFLSIPDMGIIICMMYIIIYLNIYIIY